MRHVMHIGDEGPQPDSATELWDERTRSMDNNELGSEAFCVRHAQRCLCVFGCACVWV